MSKPKQYLMVVTHQNPDLDAIGAEWLLYRYGGKKYEGMQKFFVPAGEQVSDQVLEAKGIERDEVVHVDTGLGDFDHHQQDNEARDSATLRVYERLTATNSDLASDEALRRVVMQINDSDHFAECFWPEPNHDRYQMMLDEVLKGLRSSKHFSDHELVEFGMICLDGVYASMKLKVGAEVDIKSFGQEFKTMWGKALAIENQNDEVIKLAQKMGYVVVVRKALDLGHVRIKAIPDSGVDLTELYQKIVDIDEEGTWYFHPSKTMLINGSRKNQNQVASPLSLEEVVEVVQSVK